jgi:shikimate 5-dehydrogenase
MALETFTDVPLEDVRAFVFGMGASARAAAYGMLERGAERVVFATRSPDKAPMVIERFQFAFPEQPVHVVTLGEGSDLVARREAFRDANVIVNATPAGMAGQSNGALIEDTSWIREEQLFFDFVYHPRQTAFLDIARRAGAKTLGGIALLVAQAAESFRIWTDTGFDVKEMAEAVEHFSKTEPSPGRRVN